MQLNRLEVLALYGLIMDKRCEYDLVPIEEEILKRANDFLDDVIEGVKGAKPAKIILTSDYTQ